MPTQLVNLYEQINAVNVSGISVLSPDFQLTGSDGVYQDTGLSVTLPSAGTYELNADVRGFVVGNAAGNPWFIVAKLYNSTDAADVANTETMVVLVSVTAQNFQTTAPISTKIKITESKTIKLYAFRSASGGSFTSSYILSDTNGRTRLRYLKVSKE